MQHDSVPERFARNIGFLTEEQQARLAHASVAIAGLGGVGGIIAERLVRLGIGRIHIADPEVFEPSNCNRQLLASDRTLGSNKCDVFERELTAINPELVVRTWREGIGRSPAAEFCAVDVALDCIEYLLPEYSVHLHDGARACGCPVVAVQAIGFGSTVMVFPPDGLSFRAWLGSPEETPPAEVVIPPEKFCPVLPAYIGEGVVEGVLSGAMPIPSTSIGVTTAAALASMAVLGLVLGWDGVPAVPDYLAFDPYDLVSGS